MEVLSLMRSHSLLERVSKIPPERDPEASEIEKGVVGRWRADVHGEPATGETDQARNWFAPRSSGAGIAAACAHVRNAGACCSSGTEQSVRCLASSVAPAGDRNRS